MLDIEGIKNALPDLFAALPGMQKKTANEWGGPCPKCEGTDRFIVWTETGKFLCRQCGWKGDKIDFYSWHDDTDLAGLKLKYGSASANNLI
jgi:Zn ribbon nucleic-acid-binding protein